jgi:hypothetical protein
MGPRRTQTEQSECPVGATPIRQREQIPEDQGLEAGRVGERRQLFYIDITAARIQEASSAISRHKRRVTTNLMKSVSASIFSTGIDSSSQSGAPRLSLGTSQRSVITRENFNRSETNSSTCGQLPVGDHAVHLKVEKLVPLMSANRC